MSENKAPAHPQPHPQAPQGQMPASPRPMKRPPGGMKMPPGGMKMPPGGMKMPPRPMGVGHPAGMKMPPRPMGAGHPAGHPVSAMQKAPESQELAEVEAFQEEELLEPEIPEIPEISEDFEDDFLEESEPEEAFVDDLDEPEEQDFQSDSQDEEDFYQEDAYAAQTDLPAFLSSTKKVMAFLAIFLFLGIGVGFLGGSLKGGQGQSMQGIVENGEIPGGRPRCGIAQKGQGCVFYIMNAQRRDVQAKDFFESASQALGLPKFQIETANIRYSTVRIPPGYIALLNVPPVQ